MGYNAQIIGADFTLPADKLDAAFEALKELNQRDDLKSGGSWGSLPDGTYGKVGSHFSWMDDDYDKTAQSAEHILLMLGFNISDAYEGEGIEIIGYDSKMGDEEHFIRALAPFVKPGSYLEWEGEDSKRWRWDFDGETMRESTGRIVWE